MGAIPSHYKPKNEMSNLPNVQKTQTQQWVLSIMHKNVNKEW